MKRFALVILALLVAVAPAVWILSAEFLAVDQCLDSGGSYDYAAMACDHEESHPYVPLLDRRGSLLLGTAGAALAGLVVAMIVPFGKKTAPRRITQRQVDTQRGHDA